MRINSRAKGSAGEREFCQWLENNFNNVESAERNLDQVRDGGTDVMTNGFYFEVKRVENILVGKWWSQVLKAVRKSRENPKPIPIVAYRQNRKPWKFLIPAKYLGLSKGFVQLDEAVFIRWANKYFNNS